VEKQGAGQPRASNEVDPSVQFQTMSDRFAHRALHRVRYADTDAMGVVYYANFLAYFEIGRVELLRAAGADYSTIEASGYAAAVTRADCRYHQPARFDDLLGIDTRIATVGRATMRFEYAIRRTSDEALLAEGFTEHALLDKKSLRPVRVPDAVRAAIERFQGEQAASCGPAGSTVQTR
jgi:acyl-CoA thioester hydrolase